MMSLASTTRRCALHRRCEKTNLAGAQAKRNETSRYRERSVTHAYAYLLPSGGPTNQPTPLACVTAVTAVCNRLHVLYERSASTTPKPAGSKYVPYTPCSNRSAVSSRGLCCAGLLELLGWESLPEIPESSFLLCWRTSDGYGPLGP